MGECAQCGARLPRPLPGLGRLLVYCSAACRQKAYRGRGGRASGTTGAQRRRAARPRGMVRGPHRERRARARALGRPLSRRAGRVGCDRARARIAVSARAWRPSFVTADPFPPTVTCGGSGWSLFVFVPRLH